MRYINPRLTLTLTLTERLIVYMDRRCEKQWLPATHVVANVPLAISGKVVVVVDGVVVRHRRSRMYCVTPST